MVGLWRGQFVYILVELSVDGHTDIKIKIRAFIVTKKTKKNQEICNHSPCSSSYVDSKNVSRTSNDLGGIGLSGDL